MQLYRRRHGGVSPRRVAIHKSTEFKEEEALGCFDALPTCEAIDLVQVVEDVGWRGVRRNAIARIPKSRLQMVSDQARHAYRDR
jgi:hypothetical protein